MNMPGRGNRTRLRITRRGRFLLALVVALAIGSGFMGSLSISATATAVSEGPSESFEYVTVRGGQSMWSLARSLAPSADPRDVIAAIVTLNALSSAVVEPGQRVAIPSQYRAR